MAGGFVGHDGTAIAEPTPTINIAVAIEELQPLPPFGNAYPIVATGNGREVSNNQQGPLL